MLTRNDTAQSFDITEPLLTFRQAAVASGVPYWKILGAANAGLIPTYQLLNSRRYVRMSDIERLLNAQRS